jgi:hypothetical protein
MKQLGIPGPCGAPLRRRPRQAFARGIAATREALLALLVLLFGAVAGAEQSAPTADAVKAAYIHKFAGYLDWPPATFASPTAPLVVGVVGSERVFSELVGIAAGRPVQGHTLQVRRLSKPQDLGEVSIVFIGRDAWSELDAWTAAAKGKPVAIVTDAPQGAQKGALLTFVQVQERIRFEASIPAAEQAGLRMSSRLLAVAERVVGQPP